MSRRSLTFKIEVALCFALIIPVIAGTAWYLGELTAAREDAIRIQTRTLAEATIAMSHASAKEQAKNQGLVFQRILSSATAQDPSLQQAVSNAFARPGMRQASDIVYTTDDGRTLAAYVPAVYTEECIDCHRVKVVGTLDNVRSGDVAAVFVVAGSLDNLDAAVAGSKAAVWIVTGLGALLLVFGFGMFVRKSVETPLAGVKQAVDAMASGDLTKDVAVIADTQIGALAEAVNASRRQIGGTLERVGEAMGGVATASAEISSSIDQMSTGARQQAEQVSAVVAAVEEMSQTATSSAANASDLAGLSSEMDFQAHEGARQVQEALSGVRSLAMIVQNYSSNVMTLKESHDQIVVILQSIDDIADQTNLLALNAAIEAARAGDAGRGFAVVADEVRKLSERTTGATKEIATLIRQIQSDTESAFSEVEKGFGLADAGIRSAETAEATLNGMADMAQSSSDAVKQFAASAEQQSSTTVEITKSIAAIDNVVHVSSRAIGEMARASEDLHKQAEALRGMLQWFTFGNGGTSNSYQHMDGATPVEARHYAGHSMEPELTEG
jgi:methyl-accepting chemotaxis protein